MILIVQVFPYTSNNGCSVRIGKGYCHTERLDIKACSVYEFVETRSQVKQMINWIRKLPSHYRQTQESVEKLTTYMDQHCCSGYRAS